MPNLRSHHHGPSTSNQMSYPAYVSMPQSQMQQSTLMRLNPHQIPGPGSLSTSSNASSGGIASGVHHTNPPSNYQTLPVHPNIRLSPHPFYEQQQNGELMRIKTLTSSSRQFSAKGVYENTFHFHLTPQQANLIFQHCIERNTQKRTDFGVQVLVRFCKYDTSGEQEDALPIHLSLRCNGTPVPLCNPIPTNKPGMDGRRLGRPINITPQVRISPTVPNFITVNWYFDPNNALQSQLYTVGIYLVKRLSPKDLIDKLSKDGVKPPEFAKNMIKEKMKSADCEIMTNKLRTSLRCPLIKTRIDIPLRGKRCTHLQCFDAFCYLAMNERRPTWRCPYCDQPSPYDDLYIDGFYKDVLGRCDSSVNTVEFAEDGSWSAVREDEDEEEDEPAPPPKPSAPVSAPPKNSAPPPPAAPQAAAAEGDASVIDLTEGSDEEGDASRNAAARNGSGTEPAQTGAKRELVQQSEGPAPKRPNVSTSPEIICLDSSDEEDTNARSSLPSNSNGRATVPDPDSTTPACSVANTSKGGVPETSNSMNPIACTSHFTNGGAQEFPPPTSSGSLFASQYVSGGPVFPGPPNNFY